jgi:hypothetical protein
MGKGFSRTFKFVVLGTIIGWVSLASGHSVRAAGEADLVISHARDHARCRQPHCPGRRHPRRPDSGGRDCGLRLTESETTERMMYRRWNRSWIPRSPCSFAGESK